MTNIFGTEHEPTTYKHPSGDLEQHSFRLGNDVAFSVVRTPDHGGGWGPWEAYAWRGEQPVVLTGTDSDGVAGGLDEKQVGVLLREADALPKAGA